MKKHFFIAAALVLAALLLGACGKGGSTGGSDTPYPYQLDKAGRFSILGGTPEGYAWQLTDGGGAAAAEGSGFRVTLPEGKDAATAAFALQRTGVTYQDETASLSVTFVREGDAAAVSAYRLTETAPAVSGGEGTDTPYHLWVSGEGTAVLTVETTQTLWQTAYDPALLSVQKSDDAAEGLRVYTVSAAAETGTAALKVYSVSAAAQIDVVFSLSENGLTAESHRLSAYSAADSEGYQDFAAAAGEVTLPDGAAPVDYGAESYWQDDGDDTGIVDFLWQGSRWTLVTTTAASADVLSRDYAAQATDSTADTLEGVSAAAYTFDGGSAAIWTGADGRTFCLTGETASLTAVMDAARAVLSAN